jgi:PncC family amidohydrolase
MERGRTIATAESCTGGLIAKRLTDVSGSSAYFLQGFITYSNEAKSKQLSVPPELIEAHGAVSREVAEAMAIGCRNAGRSDDAISVTGIAGPTGGTPGKPVGLVYIGLADESGCVVTEHRIGAEMTRDEIRDRAAKIALNRLRLKLLSER